MKTLLILITLLFITACERDRQYHQVTCDSGFKTPISYRTGIWDGVIEWRVVRGGSAFKRKMIPGEICTNKSITVKG